MKKSDPSVRTAKPAVTLPAPAVETAKEAQNSENVVTSYRWAWYGFALLVPFAGIFIAVFLYDQESREVRKVGRNCLIIGFSFWVILPVFMVFGFFLVLALTAFSWVSNIMPLGD